MSMLSSKCDRLRDTATRVEIFLEGCADAIPMDTHEQLRSAANTIWELSCKLAGTVDQREEIERLEDENANLRELVSLYHYGATHESSPSDTLAWSCKVDSLRRELGIGVE